MKKILFTMVMIFTAIFSANAQYRVDGHRFFDNWSAGTDGGISTNLHDWDTPNGGVWGIQLTKGVTPVVSFEFSGQLGFNDNANWNVPHSSNAVDNVTVMGSTKINLMNWFCGYTGTPRLFEIQARGGVGYMRSFYPDNGASHGSTDVNRAVAKLGVDFDFNVGKAKAWTLSVRPVVVLKGQNGDAWCDNADCSRYSHNAVGQLTAGVTYHFKNSNGEHYYTPVAPVEVTRIVEKVVEKPVQKVVEKTVEKTVTNDVTNKVTVNFEKGSYALSTDAKNALDKIASGSTVDVVGMTSPEGPVDVNTKLGQDRAKAVADYLEGRGVKVASSTGGEAARAAVVTVQK